MYEMELPSGLARFTSSREGKGGLIGTMFMALTFTIVSFACVAPFLGGFGGTAAGSQITLFDRIFGGLAFAVTFASPFFILALFPRLLKKLPKSGTLAEQRQGGDGLSRTGRRPGLLPHKRVGVAAATDAVHLRPCPRTVDRHHLFCRPLSAECLPAAARYAAGTSGRPADAVRPAVHRTWAFICCPPCSSTGSDGEKQRPNGVVYAWIDSFLLPESTGRGKGLPWGANLRKAVEEARTSPRRSDSTGCCCSTSPAKPARTAVTTSKTSSPSPRSRDLMREVRTRPTLHGQGAPGTVLAGRTRQDRQRRVSSEGRCAA